MSDPHAGQPLQMAGTPLASAKAAAVLIHGRGADAASILQLAGAIDVPGLAWLAPQAASGAWYPQRPSPLSPITSPGCHRLCAASA